MKLNDRRQGIMDALLAEGAVTVDDLSVRFGVSKMTIHRDLDELEAGGLLRKVRGGASDRVERAVRERLPLSPDARRGREGAHRHRGGPDDRAGPDRHHRRRLDRRRRGAPPGGLPTADRHHQQPDGNQRARRRGRHNPDRASADTTARSSTASSVSLRGGAARAARRRRLHLVLGDPRRRGVPPEPGGGPVQAADDGRGGSSATCWSTTASSAARRCISSRISPPSTRFSPAGRPSPPDRAALKAAGVQLNVVKETEREAAMTCLGRHQLEDEQDAGRRARLRRGARRLRPGLRRPHPALRHSSPSPRCARLSATLAGTRVRVGAQNMHWADAGAWTGEVSAPMLADCGLDLVELGHSANAASISARPTRPSASRPKPPSATACPADLRRRDAGGARGRPRRGGAAPPQIEGALQLPRRCPARGPDPVRLRAGLGDRRKAASRRRPTTPTSSRRGSDAPRPPSWPAEPPCSMAAASIPATPPN